MPGWQRSVHGCHAVCPRSLRSHLPPLPKSTATSGRIEALFGIDFAVGLDARVEFRQAVQKDSTAIEAPIAQIERLDAIIRRTFTDTLGGAASLVCGVFAEAGLHIVHSSGLAVNGVEQRIRGDERKSGPKDAVAIAELARSWRDPRAVEPSGTPDAKIRLRRCSRRESVIRAAGMKRILQKLTKAATRLHGLKPLAKNAVRAAQAKPVAIPGAGLRAETIVDIAREATAAVFPIPAVRAGLAAEFIALAHRISRFDGADVMAAAAGLAPVLRPTGKTSFLSRPADGNQALNRVYFRPTAFVSLGCADSGACCDGKSPAQNRHRRAVIALERRSVDVPWAILHSRQPFRKNFRLVA